MIATEEKKEKKINQRQPLKGLTIGLSISESPDLQQRGFGEVHLHDAMVEFARYFLASGAVLAYGGDLRPGGFTQTLFELVKMYNQEGRSQADRILNFLAWPVHLAQLRAKDQAELKNIAVFYKLIPPSDLNIDPAIYIKSDTPENRYIWARCLTAMRKTMNDFIHARLLLGGKVTGYSGKYPGIAEEAYCALKAKKPLYLIGAFGGCTKAVIDSLLNGQSDLLNYDFQIQNEDYKAMFTLYNQKIQNVPDEEPIDYKKLVSFFHEKGIAGLNNGLTEEENKRLFETIHIPEMVMLVLKGLSDLTQN